MSLVDQWMNETDLTGIVNTKAKTLLLDNNSTCKISYLVTDYIKERKEFGPFMV